MTYIGKPDYNYPCPICDCDHTHYDELKGIRRCYKCDMFISQDIFNKMKLGDIGYAP